MTDQSTSCAYLFSGSRSGGVHENRISRRWTHWNRALDIQPSSSSYASLVHNISTCVIVELKSWGFLFYPRCSIPSGFLLSCFFFFFFVYLFSCLLLGCWLEVCASTWWAHWSLYLPWREARSEWVVSRNGDGSSDGDVNEGDRSRGGSRAVGEVWLKMRVNLTSTNSSSGPTATWQWNGYMKISSINLSRSKVTYRQVVLHTSSHFRLLYSSYNTNEEEI